MSQDIKEISDEAKIAKFVGERRTESKLIDLMKSAGFSKLDIDAMIRLPVSLDCMYDMTNKIILKKIENKEDENKEKEDKGKDKTPPMLV